MDFRPTTEQELVVQLAHDYARKSLAGRALARDINSTFPEVELRELAKLGLLSVAVPQDFGGAGSDAIAYALVMQELARVDASVAVTVAVTNMVAELVVSAGSLEQKRAHVAKLADGTYGCGAFALSEPQAGSDPVAMRTRAQRTSDGWRISGTKQWITSGDRAGLVVVWAVTDPAAGHHGISAFLVRSDSPGISVVRTEDKMGLHGSSTVQLVFDGLEVSHEDQLGAVGDGFRLAMTALDGGRIGIASQAVGIAQGALEAAKSYAMEREQFGVPIIQHQAISNMLADGATWLEASRWMTLRAAWCKATGKRYTKEAAMAKLFASEKGLQICDIAIQVHGGFGYTREAQVERFYRDARAARIYEGTSEIQRIVIARQLLP